MENLIKTSTVIVILFLSACSKEESKIDKSILMNYKFEFESIFVNENSAIVQKDTILYSFINEDSVSATKYHYEPNENSIYELVCQETYSRKYTVDENSIYFLFNTCSLQTSDYLFSFQWKVKSMDTKRLSVDLYLNNHYQGSASLKCIHK